MGDENLDSLGETGSIIYFGDEKGFEQFKKDHKIANDNSDEEEEKKPEESPKVSQKTVLSVATAKKLDDDTLRILRRTRCVHDYNEVFMQANIDFYDDYYNRTEEMSEELRAARNIRRIYRSYKKYLEAVRTYYAYIDSLIDKYGEKDFMHKVQLGLIREWIPAFPLLSKSADDYDMFEAGILPTAEPHFSEEETNEFIHTWLQEHEGIECDVRGGIETSTALINELTEDEDSPYTRRQSQLCGSLDEVQNLWKSWYVSDGAGSAARELFKNAPENRKKRAEREIYYYAPGLLQKFMSGQDAQEDVKINPNEMVKDEVTNRAMTRDEYAKRTFVRFMSEFGWSEQRLLNYMNIANSLDKARLKRSANKKRRRKVEEEDVVDFDTRGIDPMYSDHEELMSSIFKLTKGD